MGQPAGDWSRWVKGPQVLRLFSGSVYMHITLLLYKVINMEKTLCKCTEVVSFFLGGGVCSV